MDDLPDQELRSKPSDSKETSRRNEFRALSEDGGEIVVFVSKGEKSSLGLSETNKSLRDRTPPRETQPEQVKVSIVLKEQPPKETFLELKVPGQTRLYLRTEKTIPSVKKEDDAVYLELVPTTMPDSVKYHKESLDKYLTNDTLQQLGRKQTELPMAA